MTISIIGYNLTLISNMDNSHTLLSKPSCRNEISPQLRDVENILESERGNHSINRGMHRNIADSSDVEDFVVSNGDCPALIINRLKIREPLKFVRHVLCGTRVSKPKSVIISRGRIVG
jgi:hypothetical protein